MRLKWCIGGLLLVFSNFVCVFECATLKDRRTQDSSYLSFSSHNDDNDERLLRVSSRTRLESPEFETKGEESRFNSHRGLGSDHETPPQSQGAYLNIRDFLTPSRRKNSFPFLGSPIPKTSPYKKRNPELEGKRASMVDSQVSRHSAVSFAKAESDSPLAPLSSTQVETRKRTNRRSAETSSTGSSSRGSPQSTSRLDRQKRTGSMGKAYSFISRTCSLIYTKLKKIWVYIVIERKVDQALDKYLGQEKRAKLAKWRDTQYQSICDHCKMVSEMAFITSSVCVDFRAFMMVAKLISDNLSKFVKLHEPKDLDKLQISSPPTAPRGTIEKLQPYFYGPIQVHGIIFVGLLLSSWLFHIIVKLFWSRVLIAGALVVYLISLLI